MAIKALSVMDCPCGSGKPLSACCGLYHEGVAAPTAETLMRSRYSAYVLGDSRYLLETWHHATRPRSLDISREDPRWQQLRIIDSEQGEPNDSEGIVEFAAYYEGGQLHERSRFLKEQGRWLYFDGELLPPYKAEKPGRNMPCPCGSGKKYKRCCG